MAASLDGYIAREDGSVDWMEIEDLYPAGVDLDAAYIAEFLQGIDCYVMGSRTYLTARQFELDGRGWAYGDKPVFVLTSQALVSQRSNVRFHSEDLSSFFATQLRPHFKNIWVAGGSKLVSDCLKLGLADEVRYSVLPIIIGKGIPFFSGIETDVRLHLEDVKAYKNGIVAMRYIVRR
jgi:dihydrofolate reductase